MAATILAPSSNGRFLDSPAYSSTQSKLSPLGFNRRNHSPVRTTLRFDISDLEGDAHTPFSLTSKVNTPDSGFFGAVSSTPLKTPESDFSSTVATPPSGGSGNGQRKRKTVTIDESQTSIVVISPDDLFNTYSKLQGQSQDQEDLFEACDLDSDQTHDNLVSEDDPQTRFVLDPFTGWPLKRSESLESRDNPFLPGGDLSREAEDLLSRATIIRDHFYLNDEEKRALQEQQLLQQQDKQHRNAKHVQIMDYTDDAIHNSEAKRRPLSSPPPPEDIEMRISPQLVENNLAAAAPPSSLNGGDNHQIRPKENGKAKEAATSLDSEKLAIPDGENQPPAPGTAQISEPAELQVHEADKKRRNKCCSIM